MSDPAFSVSPEAQAALHRQARWAGLFYGIVVVTGVFSLGVAPGRLFVGETPATLAASVAAQEQLLGLSIVAEAACYVAFGCLALSLHALLRPVSAAAAAAMAMLVLISVPFGLSNLASLVEIKRLLEGQDAHAVADAVYAAFERYRAGIFLQSVPWGLWLLPLGYLMVRSGFLPRLLGAGVMLAGAGYIAHFVARLLVEGYRESPWPQVFAAPRVAEILTAVWLLAFGARPSLFGLRL